MNKKRIYIFTFGLFLLALGLLSLLINVIKSLSFLSLLTNQTFLALILTIAGILILNTSLSIRRKSAKSLAMLAGLIIVIIGLFTFLLRLSLLKALPYIATLTISPVFLNLFLVFVALYMILDDFM